MRSQRDKKKSVNFNQQSDPQKNINNQSFRKDLSNSRLSQRESSINRLTKNQKPLIPTSESSVKIPGVDKAALNQKIKIILTKKSFIFQVWIVLFRKNILALKSKLVLI